MQMAVVTSAGCALSLDCVVVLKCAEVEVSGFTF